MSNSPPTFRRRNKLPKREFQLRLILRIVLLVAASVAVSGVVTSAVFHHWRALQYRGDDPFQYLPEDADAPVESPAAMRVMLPALLISALVTVAVAASLSLIWSFHIAGPLFRFQACAARIARGDLTTRVRIREGDELRDVADNLDDMVSQLREANRKVAEELYDAQELFHDWVHWTEELGESLESHPDPNMEEARELLDQARHFFADANKMPTITQVNRCLGRAAEAVHYFRHSPDEPAPSTD